MLEQAIQKIDTEMDLNKNNSYIQVVGKFLFEHLKANPGAAEQILTDGKTIAKSLDEMQKVAQKKQAGNCAVLTDQEGFEIILKYFGIEAPPAAPPPVPVPEKKAMDFDIRLEDLL